VLSSSPRRTATRFRCATPSPTGWAAPRGVGLAAAARALPGTIAAPASAVCAPSARALPAPALRPAHGTAGGECPGRNRPRFLLSNALSNGLRCTGVSSKMTTPIDCSFPLCLGTAKALPRRPPPPSARGDAGRAPVKPAHGRELYVPRRTMVRLAPVGVAGAGRGERPRPVLEHIRHMTSFPARAGRYVAPAGSVIVRHGRRVKKNEAGFTPGGAGRRTSRTRRAAHR